MLKKAEVRLLTRAVQCWYVLFGVSSRMAVICSDDGVLLKKEITG